MADIYEVVLKGKTIKFEYETDDPYRRPSATLARPVVAPPADLAAKGWAVAAAPKIERQKPSVLTMLPPFVRATYESTLGPRRRYSFIGYLVEIPPAVRDLTYDWSGTYERNEEVTYRVALPWTYIVFSTMAVNGEAACLASFSAYWSDHRVKNSESPLWLAHLPNVYDSGMICLGTSLGADRRSSDPSVLALAFFNKFYGSIFNDHATGELNMPDKYGNGCEGMEKWVQDSEADNFCYLSWEEFKRQPAATVQNRLIRACSTGW